MDHRGYEQYILLEMQRRLGSEVALIHGEVYKGKATTHQIDLSYTFSHNDETYFVIIECKFFNDKVGQEYLFSLQVRKEDLAAEKAILITNNGFTQGAIDFARHHKITLVVARLGVWDRLVRQSTGSPKLSSRFYHLTAPSQIETFGRAELKLRPIDERSLKRIIPIDDEAADLISTDHLIPFALVAEIVTGTAEFGPGVLYAVT